MAASDSVLIERSLAGELGAFDDLMARYQGLVFHIAITYAREREAARDISQDAFLKAYERLSSLRTGASFKPWIAQIAYHESLNWVRRNRRGPHLLDLPEADHLATSAPSQEDGLLTRESGALMSHRLSRLNPRYRMVVTLRYFEELSIAEIAGVLRCSEGLVKNMLFRSLRQLRTQLLEPTEVS